ncbi:4'-phosphopantetheinyl transferase superfamily protein [bacterium]|nr:4'-phosphopantetheinyl transferase superfamily protein [bacterium]
MIESAVHIRIIDLPGNSPDLAPMDLAELASLSESEVQRAAAMPPYAKARFIRMRSALREILGDRLGIEPAGVPITINAMGKPYILGSPVHFNISHTADMGLIAVGEKPVGIDIEKQTNRPNMRAIAQRIFHPEELKRIEQTDGVLRQKSFFEIWTRKEAAIKCIGGSVFQGREFSCVGSGHGLVHWENAEMGAVSWRDVNVSSRYAAAVAVQGGAGIRVNIQDI